MGGRFGQQAVDSRQQVIENGALPAFSHLAHHISDLGCTNTSGRRRIAEVANAMGLQEHIAEAAQRWFNLCITTNFIKGRRTREVAAVCLYVACRMNKSSRMLIDFSVALKVRSLPNVIYGGTF